MAKLTITDEHGKERVHELVDAVTLIGRASTNTIQVTDEKASRQHFRVDKDGERFKFVDLGSTNAVRINGVKTKDSVLLCNGDVLNFGKTTFKYEGPGEPIAKPAAAEHAPSTIVIPPGTPAAAPSEKKAAPLKIDSGADAPKYVLRVLEGGNPGKVYELGATALTLGRHASNTIQVLDDAASNYHAEVNREPMGYVVTDLGSTNGTRVKSKGKTDFEKVVKTPLSPGAQIRIGKTVLEYENIGKPEEDQLFGTIALDPEKLGDKLEEPKRGGGLKLVAALVLVALIGGIAFVASNRDTTHGDPPAPRKDIPPPSDLSNRIANGDFTEGTDDEGNPKQFRIERGAPGVKVAVAADADRGGGTPVAPVAPVDPTKPVVPPTPVANKLGLQVAKSGKSGAALTAVETAATFAIDAGKAYELSGWMKNDGDGLFGLRVTWIAGDRKLSEHPVVLKDTQEWKEKTITITPPSWAQRARAGVFVQGKDGKASFDDLGFRERPDASPTSFPSVKFGAIAIHFEGSKGVFTGSLQGETVIEDGTLLLRGPDNQSIDLTSAVDPRTKAEGAGAAIDGRVYDFALQELTNYRIEALPGGSGVDLRAAVDTPHEQGCKPELRFYIAGAVAAGDVEVTKGGAAQRITSADAMQSIGGVEELLFNAGKTPQLNITFAKPVDVELKREGARRNVTISFRGELQLAIAPESQAQKKQMLALIEALQTSLNVKRWGDAEAKLAQLKQQYKARFPQAAEESTRADSVIDKAWTNAKEEVQRSIDNVKTLKTSASGNLAKDTITRHATEWTGSERASQLTANLPIIADLLKEGDAMKAEDEAAKLFAQAEEMHRKGVYAVAMSILRVKILNDKINKNTKVAAEAQKLLDKCEIGERRQRDLRVIEEKLNEKVKNYLLTSDYKSAIDAVEKDKEYQDNRADLPQINTKLEDWKRRATK